MPGPMWEDPDFGWMLTPDIGVHGAELAQPVGFLWDQFAQPKRQAPKVRARSSARKTSPSRAARRRPAAASNNRRSRK